MSKITFGKTEVQQKSSRSKKQPPKVFYKKDVPHKVAGLPLVSFYTPWKHPIFSGVWKETSSRPTAILKKKLWHRYFPVSFVKILRITFLQNTSKQLLLKKRINLIFVSSWRLLKNLLSTPLVHRKTWTRVQSRV